MRMLHGRSRKKHTGSARAAMLEEVLDRRMRIEEIIGEKGGGHWDMIDRSPNLIQSVTPDGRFFYVNRTWRDTLGYSDEEIERLNFVDVLSHGCRDRCVGIFQMMQEGKTFDEVDCEFLTGDGRAIQLKGNVSCHFEKGKTTATRGIFRIVSSPASGEQEPAAAEDGVKLETDEGVEGRFDAEEFFLEFQDLVSLGRKTRRPVVPEAPES